MKLPSLIFVLVASLAAAPLRALTSAQQYLRYLYGADDVPIEAVCWPHDDLWMLHGKKSPAGLAEIEAATISPGKNEIVWKTIQNGLCIVEMRDGRVDPRFLLDQTYFSHRQTVLQFVYASLSQDAELLERVTTERANVRFGRAKPQPPGDMDVYSEILARMPVIRVSSPATDKVAQAVSYRLPLGASGFVVRLVKRDGAWKVDTDKRVNVPLEFFFQ